MGSGCSCFLFAIKARGHHDAAVFGGARRLNLVRLRYGDVPVFLAVDSVLTQYVYAGEASLTGSVGRASGDSLSSVIGAVGATYIERPTVTYSPITGEKFAEQLLDPIQDGLVLSLVQSGWPAYEVLIMSLERLNNLQNLTFESSRPPAREELEEFEH